MQAVKQIVDSEKLLPVAEYSEEFYRRDFENAINELQKESVANGTSNMTMEEINAEIALYRKEKAEQNAVK